MHQAPRYNFILCTSAKSPPPLFVYPGGNTDIIIIIAERLSARLMIVHSALAMVYIYTCL